MATRVDLWHVRTDEVDATTIEVCARLLDAKEETRRASFVFERHRHEYLVTRGLARGVISTYVGRPPGELSFFLTAHDRPLLVDAGDVRFNLTNTSKLVACAVSRGREIGVDAEPLERADTILGIAETVFTLRERENLSRLPMAARRRRAVELWTLKEAYIKARGLGLSLPVERLDVVFADDGDGPPGLRFLPPLEDVAGRWALSTFDIEGHLVSTCAEIEDGGHVEVTVRRAELSALLSDQQR